LRGGLVQPVIVQVVLLILSSSIFDGGFSSGLVMVGVISHWIVVALIALRRRNQLTRTDEILIRAGYVLWSALALVGYLAVGYICYYLPQVAGMI
jgi:hypothetical protein